MTMVVVLMVLLIMFVGALLAVTPWIMPPTECFAVTVPPSAQADPRVRGYKRTYSILALGVTAACALAVVPVLVRVGGVAQPTNEQAVLLSTAITAATLVPIVAGTVLMLHYRRLVQELKVEQGWTVSTPRAAAVLGGNVPQPISLAWNLLYVVVALALAAFALASYERFPEQIPINADFAGNVSRHVPKSMGSVLFPALFTAFMGVVFTIAHAMTIMSKKPVDPAAPATSAYAYGRFARLYSQVMLVMGLVLSSTMGTCFYLSSLGVISMGSAAIAMMVTTLVCVGVIAVVSIANGQAGGRLAADLRSTDEVARDDDALWPLGLFYCNADDPSIIVPKRFGVGWTINVARPAAWAMMAGLAVITVAFCLLVNWAVG